MKRAGDVRALVTEVAEATVAMAVVVAVVIAVGKRVPVAAAIAVGVAIVIGELALSQSRQRIAVLNRLGKDLSEANHDLSARVAALDARLRAGTPPGELELDPMSDRPTVAPRPVDTAAVPVALRQFVANGARDDDFQCPSCGRLQVDTADGTIFQCRACDSNWKWRRGTPWPDVRIVPDLRQVHAGPAAPS